MTERRRMHEVERIKQDLQEAVEGMSLEALAALAEFRRIIREEGMNERTLVKGFALMVDLPPSEAEEIKAVFRLEAELRAAQEEEDKGNRNLLEQVSAVMHRALELEPALPEEGLTVRRAIEVLERHGVKHGISREVMEMEWEVPPPE